MKQFTLLLALAFTAPSFSQDSNSPLVSFDDYENLMKTVKEHRKTRLVGLDLFNEMSTREGVYILDTRSKEMYDRKHVKGAIHLNFSDFTQANLDMLFPNRNATILIYCNNNFFGGYDIEPISLERFMLQDQSFASKGSAPIFFETLIDPIIGIQDFQAVPTEPIQTTNQTKIEEIEEIEEIKILSTLPKSSITLALNIPTYINLFGYGYKNVYELSELISVFDSRIQFEGSEVLRVEN